MTAPETLEGWYALHEMRRLDRRSWRALGDGDRAKARDEMSALLASAEAVEDAGAGLTAVYRVIGHKADLLTVHLRPEMSQLRMLEQAFEATTVGAFTEEVFSYLSVTEVSRHGSPEGAVENIADSPHVQSRLYPVLPGHSRYLCFYPMSKRRAVGENWYLLDGDERADLMRAHGRTGRRYAGRVTQIVSGSIGLDDWEWGVTLFSDDPLLFKKLVHEMRFDEVSARYAEFGPFYVGERMVRDDLIGWLG